MSARGWARVLVGEQPALAAALLAFATAAWVATDLRMAGMDAGPGTDPGSLGFYLSTWVVMMAAMMLPAATPMVLAHRESRRERDRQRRTAFVGDAALVVTGYLAVWATAGLIGYAALDEGRALAGGFFAWGHAGRWTATGVLVVAALYQLTPFKHACLARCRSRRASLLADRQRGHDAALRVGMRHGVSCLGCCWGLMAALFALGAMNLGWMVVISVLIAGERLLRWRRLTTAIVTSVLAALAFGLAIAPARVPMLTIPGSTTAMRAMGMSPPDHMHIVERTTVAPGMGAMKR